MNNLLLKKILEFRAKRDWKKYHTPRNLAASLVIEASEALEVLQWKMDDEISDKERGKLKEGLADVYGYLLLLSHDAKIDLDQALEEKLKKNEEKYPLSKTKDIWRKYTDL